MGKYDPLRDYLSRQPVTAANIAMSFEEIEALVGRLPDSARNQRAWWGNDSKTHAEAWHTAGWHVCSMSQIRERVVFSRFNWDGHPDRPPETPENWLFAADRQKMPEERVRSLLVDYLTREGWEIKNVADPRTGERDVDILASCAGRALVIDVQGYPVTSQSDPQRASEPKPSPATRAQHRYADALLKAMLTRADHPDHDFAIALPDVEEYRDLVTRTRSSLDLLNVRVFFVSPDGKVTTIWAG